MSMGSKRKLIDQQSGVKVSAMLAGGMVFRIWNNTWPLAEPSPAYDASRLLLRCDLTMSANNEI